LGVVENGRIWWRFDPDQGDPPFIDIRELTMRNLPILVSLVMLAVAPCAVHAQTKLKLSISVEGLDEDARQCGVSEQTVRAPAVLTLRNNRIDVLNDRTSPYLSIKPNIMALASGNHCVYALEVAIRDEEPPKARGGFKTKRASSIFLCKQDSLWIVPKADVPSKLADSVDQLLKLCLSNIDY